MIGILIGDGSYLHRHGSQGIVPISPWLPNYPSITCSVSSTVPAPVEVGVMAVPIPPSTLVLLGTILIRGCDIIVLVISTEGLAVVSLFHRITSVATISEEEKNTFILDKHWLY
ncbi:unnamed protein product, partial [Meganyctiphanes norvegica]